VEHLLAVASNRVRTADLSPASFVERFRLRAMMESRARGANR